MSWTPRDIENRRERTRPVCNNWTIVIQVYLVNRESELLSASQTIDRITKVTEPQFNQRHRITRNVSVQRLF